MHRIARVQLAGGLALLLAACGDTAQLPEEAGYGPDPTLPEPNETLVPTVDIASAVGWPSGAKPQAAPGLVVNAYATGLDHPRWLCLLPNGDVLVAETNAPPRPEDESGIKAWIRGMILADAGATVPSANRISLLRDADGDGVAELKTQFLSGLNSPFGMALVGSDLYVANTDAVMRFPYVEGATQITAPGVKVADLPAGPLNHHWTKSLIASPDGSRLYATAGSNSNVGENGLEKEEGRAAIHEIDPRTGQSRLFASGLRNPLGLAWRDGVLWTTVNERDEIGSDLVPDYMTSVKDGGFYGWPYSYYGQHVDERVEPQNPDLVAKAIKPDYALGSHTAVMGLAFTKGTSWPIPFADGAFVGQHGSWNRDPPAGYRVVFVPFVAGSPTGLPVPVLTGFINADDEAMGRPVGIVLDRAGALLVADDVGNTVWRVVPAAATAMSQQ